MFQDNDIKEILKRAKNVKEVLFKFPPLMRNIEMLPKSLEHLLFLSLKDRVPYSGKFRRLKSLNLKDNRFFSFETLKKF